MRSGIGGVLHIVAMHAVPCRTQSRRALQSTKRPAPGLAMTAMPMCCELSREEGLRLQSGPSLGAKTRRDIRACREREM